MNETFDRNYNSVPTRDRWVWWFAPLLVLLVPILASGSLWLLYYRDIVSASHDVDATLRTSKLTSFATFAAIVCATIFLFRADRRKSYLRPAVVFIAALITFVMLHPGVAIRCSQVGISSALTGFVALTQPTCW